jgi:hypothetical protein
MESLHMSAARRPSFGTAGDIPPFSSYGGILGAVRKTAPFFARNPRDRDARRGAMQSASSPVAPELTDFHQEC